jgi:glucose-1-phosphate thymidylyltransferase
VIGIVLAAGLGTRLRPYSDVVSKAAMPVAGVPIVLRVIEQFLAAGGVGRVIVVARSPEHDIIPLIREHARRRGYDVAFGYQPEQRGSAHALMQVPDLGRLDEHVLIGACDNLYEPSEVAALVEQHARRRADGTMAVLRVPPEKVAASSSVVVDAGRVVRLIEKPALDQVASPFCGPLLYAFSPQIFAHLNDVRPSRRDELEFQDAIQAFIEAGARVEWFELSGRMTLTTPDDLLALNERFFGATSAPTPMPRRGVTFVPPCVVDDEVAIGPGSTIGPNVHLMRGCRIGRACTVRHALVFPGAHVADDSTVEHTLAV